MMKRYDIKRFMEYWTGDPVFQKRFSDSPKAAVIEYALVVDADACAILTESNPDIKTHHPDISAYQAWTRALVQKRRLMRHEGRTDNPAFAAWRSRQIMRYYHQATPVFFDKNVHLPWTIELSEGCSIGCSYCGFNAGPLRHVARFTPENERLFRGILGVMARFFGKGAELCILYNATEPLDNPDYEKYLHAFYQELAVTPQTTTAAWFRDLPRTRRLLEQSRAENGYVNRFSINSVPHFHLVMKWFSARELDDVLLLKMWPEASTPKVLAGRGKQSGIGHIKGTVGCTTGFRINLCERRISLLSPTNDLERWPNGEMVFAEDRFDSPEQVARFVKKCNSRFFEFSPGDGFVPIFRQNLRPGISNGFRLTLNSSQGSCVFHDGFTARVASSMDGEKTIADIVNGFARQRQNDARNTIIGFWKAGFLDEIAVQG